MVEVYDSLEQGERVKSWLRQNGGAIVMGLVLAFGGLFGFKQWQVWETGKTRQASAEYEAMVDLLAENKVDSAIANFDTIHNDYPNSVYAPLASLHMAKARVDAGQGDLAIGLLEHAMASAQPEPLRIIARERLARLMLDLGDTQAALELLDAAPSDLGFQASFAEIRGDIYLAMGNEAEAISHYQLALDLQDTGLGNRAFLEMKLEALGGVEGQDS
jgi:predicted negative regulator of RcsB-dependent stress response